MMPPAPVTIEERLRDIMKWGDALTRHIGDLEQQQFLQDEKTQHAVMKCIEAIGEAAKELLKLDVNFDLGHPELRLKAAARMRDRLTHSYRDIDLHVLWATATTSVPDTVAAAEKILRSDKL